MKAKEYFKKIEDLSNRIERKKQKLEIYKETPIGLGNSNLDSCVKVKKWKNTHMEDMIIKIMDIEKEIDDDLYELSLLKVKAMELIENLKDINQQKILFLKYIKKMTWKEISSKMGYSMSYIFSIHKRGIDELDNCS